MSYDLLLKLRAEEELTRATEWYENRQKGLGLEFLQQAERSLIEIKENPLRFPVKRYPYHEAVVQRFPFIIIYTFFGNEIIIYSVFNTSRNPEAKG